MKLGLENITTLLTALDSPESKYLKVQVAGTNGKGSVCAFLDSICVSAGIKTGAFTSPHLISITERVRIDGIDITEVEFARHATVVRQTAEILLGSGELEYLPTFFEQITAIALFAFAEAKCEVAILETGLGGRLDATTAANAEIAAITQIDFDHQEYLGQTLSEIASEKAAIIHAESTVVVGGQNHEAGNLIRKRIANLGLEASLSDDVSVFSDGQTVRFQTKRDIYEVARLGLTGRHQLENAKVAILLAETLKSHFPISAADIVSGLIDARHPGRLERIGRFLLDGAHNPAGAAALREYLDEEFAGPITVVFGAMREKDIDAVAKQLFPRASKLILTSPNNSRSMPPGELASQFAAGMPFDVVSVTDDVSAAIERALAVTPDDGIILITGSLYLVGEAKKILNN